LGEKHPYECCRDSYYMKKFGLKGPSPKATFYCFYNDKTTPTPPAYPNGCTVQKSIPCHQGPEWKHYCTTDEAQSPWTWGVPKRAYVPGVGLCWVWTGSKDDKAFLKKKGLTMKQVILPESYQK